MSGRRDMPEWEQALRSELARINANLLIIYDTDQGSFDGSGSAPDLIKHLTRRGYKWANVTRQTMSRWRRRIAAIAKQHAFSSE